ncbi:hypothetical protein EV182_002640 [Spiromyces aspiralis]|uniref:Uncharacterized protein n=1 Tax=Spiromyces aspiralis TaxID=68401 RepID=A0ACC1HDR8_9FUNG|nr:hypothetical protein EV182_002640 [Spiromyces aspiralis]
MFKRNTYIMSNGDITMVPIYVVNGDGVPASHFVEPPKSKPKPKSGNNPVYFVGFLKHGDDSDDPFEGSDSPKSAMAATTSPAELFAGTKDDTYA